MPTTVLIGSPETSWREWLDSERGKRDLIVADPADTTFGTPAALSLYRGKKCVKWVFVGSLDGAKNPIAMVSGLAELMHEAGGDALILFPKFRAAPVARQLLTAMAQVAKPDQILMPTEGEVPAEGWPVGPEPVDLVPEFPPMVQAAQRRARWLEMLERTHDHEALIQNVAIQGARLGSGIPLTTDQRERLGIEGLVWAEICGPALLLICKQTIDEDELGRALDLTHCSKAFVVDSLAYSGKICSFAKQSGEDYGMGLIEELDFARGLILVRCDAVPPSPVRIIKLGLLRVESGGKELGEDKPWAV